jgi:LuxR family transcriptional regulator, quorum-sensing system regulator CviR
MVHIPNKMKKVRKFSSLPLQLKSLLSGDDAILLLELIQMSIACSVKEDFIGLYPKIKNLFPFDFSAAFLGCRKTDGVVVLDGVNISYPVEFFKIYKTKNYWQRDAVVKENFAHYKIQHRFMHRMRQDQLNEVVSLGMDFGMRSVHAHGSKTYSKESNGSLFVFTNSSMETDKRINAILELIVPHLHLALSRVCTTKEFENNGVLLSNREKEVLNWLKQGKSSWDISAILGISESTVNFHIYNAMQKLGTTNRPQSIAVATRLGLIDID